MNKNVTGKAIVAQVRAATGAACYGLSCSCSE